MVKAKAVSPPEQDRGGAHTDTADLGNSEPPRPRLARPTRRASETFVTQAPGFMGSPAAGGTLATVAPFDSCDPAPEDHTTALTDADDRFEDHGIIGRGGMGEVRLLLDRDLGRSLVRKEIRPDRPASPQEHRRFLTEARITAQLAHPGIVPVHDVGELPDGRPFYTMREVRGLTLSEAMGNLRGGRRGEEATGLRRLLDALLRATETVAYAHSRGIIHRDLKPDNIMLGEFGAVMVLDWGLARSLHGTEDVLAGGTSGGDGLTLAGRVLGTPGYLPPEQAAGRLDAMGPHSDVFALGAVLYELLSGRLAYPGSPEERVAATLAGAPPALGPEVDPELSAICSRCLQFEPGARFASAQGLAEALGDWLAGARRRERALEAVAEADAHHQAARVARAQAADLRQEAVAILETLHSYDAAAAKLPGWRKEDEAAELEARAELEDARFVSRLHGALQLDPELHEAHARLATFYRDRHEAAERSQDRGLAVRSEELLRTHDRGEHADYLAGMGLLRLVTEPPVAEARVSRFVLRDRRLEAELVLTCGPEGLAALRLPAGSYLVELEAEGCAPARYPVRLERGGEWAEAPVRLLPADRVAPDDCFVPAGPCWTGGDPEAADGLPGRRVHVDAFVLKRFPVTHAEYLAFLNDLVAQGRTAEAEGLAPGAFRSDGDARNYSYLRMEDGRFHLGVGEKTWLPEGPAVSITWLGATAYCAWRSAREELPWRLCHSLEWEKAARGVDGRTFPWGNHLEPTWANIVDGIKGKPDPVAVDSFPLDVSVYGVRGLVGNSRDWCQDPYRRDGPALLGDRVDPAEGALPTETFRMVKGGSVWNGGALVRPATRLGASPHVGFDLVGFRLARSVPSA